MSPFLSKAVAKLIAEAARFSGAGDLRFITALGADPVRSCVLSVAGLEALSAAGFSLRAIPNLHAKTAIVDGTWGLVGSGNFTVTGLGGWSGEGNVELGVVLSRRQVPSAVAHFERWWSGGEPISSGDLLYYRRWTPKRGGAGGTAKKHGPFHGTPLPTRRGRELSRLLAERAPSRGDRTYWLKMLYYDERDLDRWWETMTWVSDVHRRRPQDGKPMWRPTYRVGDLLVLYLVGRACPAIAEVKEEPVFDPARVERDSSRSDADRWGWVTDVRVIHKTEAGLGDAPDLNLLGIGPSSVRQHGHIRISADAYSRALEAIETN